MSETRYKFSNFGEFEDEFIREIVVVNDGINSVVAKTGAYIDEFVVAAMKEFTEKAAFDLDRTAAGEWKLSCFFLELPMHLQPEGADTSFEEVLEETVDQGSGGGPEFYVELGAILRKYADICDKKAKEEIELM